nr:hypothetical protein [Tanacetum cinerariifolium]
MTSFGYRLNPRYAIKECSSCGALYTRDCSCSKGSVEDKILVHKPPKNCARCGHPVNGPYCQGCTLLREKLKEDLVSYFQNFQNTSESSDGNTNVVNAPREPFVVKQDHGVNPPHIDECCCECDEALDGISCQQCACKSCGKAQYWKIPACCDDDDDDESAITPILSTKEPIDSLSFDQTQPPRSPVVHPPPQETSIEISHDQENVLLLAWDRVSKIKDAFENKQYKPEDIQELFRKLLEDLQNIHEELAEFINSLSWNRPAVYDDDDDDVDYTIPITPVLSTEELDNSLSMGDEHLDTIPATKSDEVIKSSVEDLVPIPSEFKGIPDTMCDVHLVNNPTPLKAKDHFEIVINSNDDYSSSDDDSLYYKNIEYVEASPHDSEFVSLEFPPFDRSDFTHKEFDDEPAHIISPPEYDCFYFWNLPDPGELISSLNSEIRKNLSPTTCVNLPVEDDYSPLLAYIVWIFVAYLTYPVIPPHLHSFENEDTIFDTGITINRFYSFKLGLSNRCGTFKEFNTHRSHLNESP